MYALDFFENALILHDSQTDKLLCSPVLIKDIVRVLAKLFHVCSYKHLTELDEITVIFVVNLYNTPWICPSTDFTTIGSLNGLIGTYYSEGNLAGNFFCLCKSFLVLVFVGGRLEDMDIMICNISKNLV